MTGAVGFGAKNLVTAALSVRAMGPGNTNERTQLHEDPSNEHLLQIHDTQQSAYQASWRRQCAQQER